MIKQFEILDFKNYRNIFICGDIHGEINMLYDKLNEVKFNKETDLLIATGDLVDRGSNSLDCINLLNESWFKSVMGNHELFCLMPTYKDIHIQNGGMWFWDLDVNERNNVVHLITEKMPICIELNDYINNKKYGIIHADIPYNDWDVFKEKFLIDLNGDKNNRSFIDICLWSRDRIYDNKSVEIKNIDEIYFGHTVIKQPFKIANCNYIDTGAVFNKHGGYLTMIKIK